MHGMICMILCGMKESKNQIFITKNTRFKRIYEMKACNFLKNSLARKYQELDKMRFLRFKVCKESL